MFYLCKSQLIYFVLIKPLENVFDEILISFSLYIYVVAKIGICPNSNFGHNIHFYDLASFFLSFYCAIRPRSCDSSYEYEL